ncbi:auxin-responsive protein IAA13-like [Malania oleifera]|uniref:auxin-responsive protein IAA13-like n=1 Tax=Malania oleifera TaxID=397392 RepID=UPI0025AE4EBA|nr:auxin-responsive protein IAA13-like [Malania oleifera]
MAYRMNILANQVKTLTSKEDETCEDDKLKQTSKKKVYNGSNKNNTVAMEKGHLGLVKVNMDGLPIRRKMDLNASSIYETLAQARRTCLLIQPQASLPLMSGTETDWVIELHDSRELEP